MCVGGSVCHFMAEGSCYYHHTVGGGGGWTLHVHVHVHSLMYTIRLLCLPDQTMYAASL